MGFLSDLLKRGKKTSSERHDAIVTSKNVEVGKCLIKEDLLEFGDDGCITYPDGIILKTIDEDAYNNYEFSDIIASLGYKQGELYEDYYCDDKSDEMFGFIPEETDLITFSELFTDKLVLVLRHDRKVMSRKELDQLKTKMKNNAHPVWGLSRHDLLLKIGYAIEDSENKPISRQFIERIFNKNSDKNIIEAGKFHFEFSNDILCACSYDGYDVQIFIKDYGIAYSEIDDYFEYANKSYKSAETMKKIIHYQSYCANIIDDDIMASKMSCKKFAYDDDGFCINFIAMAAYYKQCDVDQDMFIKSTDGQYEIISKETHNGITITKIRAYRETFTFTNGHTMPEGFANNPVNQSLTSYSTGDNRNGYVYVMINSSFNDMVKIGKTTKDPNERAKELSSATGVPTPFVVVFYKEFANCDIAENQIHKFLEDAGCRVNDNREFFRVPVKEAIEVVQLFYDKEKIEQPIAASQEELSEVETSCLYGRWEAKRINFDGTWYDVPKDRFEEFGRILILNENGTFEENSGSNENHIGTYEIIGRDVHTYLTDGKYIIYHINSVDSHFADMTLIILDYRVQIEFER